MYYIFTIIILYTSHSTGLVLFHKFIRALTGNIQVNIPVLTVLENAMLSPPLKNLLTKFVLKYIHIQILFSKVGGSIMFMCH